MNDIPLPLVLASGQAESKLSSARTLRDDVVWPVETCYESLAWRLLFLFAANSGLQSVSIHCWMVPEVSETDTTHHIALRQHLKLTTVGAEVFEDIEAKMTFLAQHAPLHLMGSGNLVFERSAPAVAAMLADLTADSVPAQIRTFAASMVSLFKHIQVEVYSGQHLG